MYRIAVLFSMLAAFVLAAPAPIPKPGPKGPWFDGWGEPVDKKKDCRFDRKGSKLTITVPGKGHKLDLVPDRPGYRLGANSPAPMLLREVEGDFTVRVHVSGTVEPAPQAGGELFEAGLLLLDGNKRLGQLTPCAYNRERHLYIMIQRRGDVVSLKWSQHSPIGPDDPDSTYRIQASKKLKLAIVASSAGDGVFKAEFDQLELMKAGATK